MEYLLTLLTVDFLIILSVLWMRLLGLHSALMCSSAAPLTAQSSCGSNTTFVPCWPSPAFVELCRTSSGPTGRRQCLVLSAWDNWKSGTWVWTCELACARPVIWWIGCSGLPRLKVLVDPLHYLQSGASHSTAYGPHGEHEEPALLYTDRLCPGGRQQWCCKCLSTQEPPWREQPGKTETGPTSEIPFISGWVQRELEVIAR